jgi:ubiquinol oxidase
MNAPIQIADPKAPTPSVVLRAEQDATLAAPRRPYGILARTLFATVGAIYGPRSLETFRVLEIVARVPYQAWENVGYVAITHTHERVSFARNVFDYVEEARSQQDNEQWHLLILEDLLRRRPDHRERGLVFGRLVPQILALVYYHLSWLLYVIAPTQSYALNADFEDHAEHEYMELVRDNPELDATPWRSALARDYGRYATVADVLRRIALDERVHKEESLVRLLAPRFRGVTEDAPRASIS